jgi:hypothetical protein
VHFASDAMADERAHHRKPVALGMLLDGVADPEIPVVSVRELGIIRAVRAEGGRIAVKEVDDNETYVTIDADLPSGSTHSSTVRVTAEQLWKLAVGIASMFDGAIALTRDARRVRVDDLRARIERVLSENESRCLDDDIDRGVVLGELVRTLS